MASPVEDACFRSLLYGGGSSTELVDDGDLIRSGVGDTVSRLPGRLLVRLVALPPGAGEVEVARLNGLGTGSDDVDETERDARGGGGSFR